METILLVAHGHNTELRTPLERRGYRVAVAQHPSEVRRWLTSEDVRLTIFALPLPTVRLSEFLQALEPDLRSSLAFMATGVDAELPATEVFDLGAQDYIANPLGDVPEFLASVGVLLGSRRGDVQMRYLRTKALSPVGWGQAIGQSPALRRVIETLQQVCRRTSSGATPTILLGGETGTGKGFFAKCIHNNGARRNKAFVDINCASLPPSLIEAELFGHEKGSFTDAKIARAGLFETADGGTLFLDEIATLPLDLQAKLLTVLEEKHVRRLGGRQSVKVDVQVVAATHRNLLAAVREKQFREDLYHRLNVISITIPPLRQRGRDILMLAEDFLMQLCREYGMPPRVFSEEAQVWMLSYLWPGNVRELRNLIERIVLLENDTTVRVEHLRGTIRSESTPPPALVSMPSLSLPPSPSLPPSLSPSSTPPSVEISRSGSRLRVSLPPNGASLEEIEREVISAALEQCDGNVSAAARFLSISRQTLIYRMKKFGLSERPRSSSG